MYVGILVGMYVCICICICIMYMYNAYVYIYVHVHVCTMYVQAYRDLSIWFESILRKTKLICKCYL